MKQFRIHRIKVLDDETTLGEIYEVKEGSIYSLSTGFYTLEDKDIGLSYTNHQYQKTGKIYDQNGKEITKVVGNCLPTDRAITFQPYDDNGKKTFVSMNVEGFDGIILNISDDKKINHIKIGSYNNNVFMNNTQEFINKYITQEELNNPNFLIQITFTRKYKLKGVKSFDNWVNCVNEMGDWYQKNINTYCKLAASTRANTSNGRYFYYCPLIDGYVGDDCSSFTWACLTYANIVTTKTSPGGNPISKTNVGIYAQEKTFLTASDKSLKWDLIHYSYPESNDIYPSVSNQPPSSVQIRDKQCVKENFEEVKGQDEPYDILTFFSKKLGGHIEVCYKYGKGGTTKVDADGRSFSWGNVFNGRKIQIKNQTIERGPGQPARRCGKPLIHIDRYKS